MSSQRYTATVEKVQFTPAEQTALRGRFVWKPGCGVPHPDADAIIKWAQGQARLEARHLHVQQDLDMEEKYALLPYPSFNPARTKLRICTKGLVGALYTDLLTNNTKPVVVHADEAKDWEVKWAGQKRRFTPWGRVDNDVPLTD